jgi:hypothetical protein
MPYIEMFKDNYDKFLDLELLGSKEIGGRSCHEFQIGVEGNTLIQLTESSESSVSLFGSSPDTLMKDNQIKYNICMDKQHGFMVYFGMDVIKYSQLAGKDTKSFSMTMSLESYDPNGASASDLVIPVEYSVESAECEKEYLNITMAAFKDLNENFDVKIGEYAYGSDETVYDATYRLSTGAMSFGEKKTFKITLDEELTAGMYEIAVCPQQGDCITNTCTYYPELDYDF